jgi:hypothetical protein
MSTGPNTGLRLWQPTACCAMRLEGPFPCSRLLVCVQLYYSRVLLTVVVYNNLGYSWASSLLAFLAVAFVPLPWIFYRFGTRIRQSSAYT